MKKKIAILTGSGISQESGIATFRDSNGLWENHDVNKVASPSGWLMDEALVLKFYNERRKQIAVVEPNEAHKQLARLEEKYDVSIITQNIDDLHERGGSSKVLHVHGIITQAKSSGNHDYIVDIGYEDIKVGDLCPEGFQMRPNIVWFGESVPLMSTAEVLANDADIFIIIGTSFSVYPAAGLFGRTREGVPIYVIDPAQMPILGKSNVEYIQEKATKGVTDLVNKLLEESI